MDRVNSNDNESDGNSHPHRPGADSDTAGDDTDIRRACEQGLWDHAVTVTLQRHGPAILGWLRTHARGSDDAVEVNARFQVKVLEQLPGFRWQCSLRSWLYRVAHSSLADFYRGQAGRAGAGDRTVSQLPRLPSALTTEQRFRGNTGVTRESTVPWLRTEVKDAFAALCERHLSVEERHLLYLRVTCNMTWEAVALEMAEGALDQEELARRSASVRKRFSRLKSKLEEVARAEGLDPREGR